MTNFGKPLGITVNQENKILNNSFKNIIKYILPDDYRIAFTLVENIDPKKYDLMKKLAKFPKYQRNSMIQSSDLTNIETLIMNDPNPSAFIEG